MPRPRASTSATARPASRDSGRASNRAVNTTAQARFGAANFLRKRELIARCKRPGVEADCAGGAHSQVAGTGSMKEENAASAVPITVTGTFQRPVLTLAFDGMVYESQQVKGAAQGSYTTVGGIGTTLSLTAPGYSREVAILLQEEL